MQEAQMAHTCHQGPVCTAWEDEKAWALGCGHESCAEINHELCIPCEAEEMEREHQQWLARRWQWRLMENLRCPVDTLLVRYRAAFGAPGYGNSAECPLGHAYAEIAGTLYHLEDQVHILEPWMVA